MGSLRHRLLLCRDLGPAGGSNSGSGYLTVTGSRIGSRAAGNTSQLGISAANGQTLQVTGCDLRLNSLGAIAASSNVAAINASGNFGFVSRFGGQLSSPANATSVTITHNLSLAPNTVAITWLSQLASGVQWWVSNITTTTFQLNVSAPNAATTYFSFTAGACGYN